jgi:hypothetical protein
MIVNHLDVVQQCHAANPPTSGSLASCFAFEQRVLAELNRRFPREAWGYLAKGGENVLNINGEWIKVGRVCGPDAQLYKILTDIPTTNDPIWNDDGNLTVDFPGTKATQWYRPFEGTGEVPAPPIEVPPPVLPPNPVDVFALIKAFSIDVAQLKAAVAHLEGLLVVQHDEVLSKIDAVVLEGKVPYLGVVTLAKPTPKPKTR